MIKVFKINDLRYTPFDQNFIKEDFSYLEKAGIIITTKKKEADIFVSSHPKNIKKFILKNPFKRNFLLWTNEPRNSQTNSKSYLPFFMLWKVNVMNVYSGDIFVSNVSYQEKRFLLNKEKEHLSPMTFSLSNKKVVALMSYYQGGKNSKCIIDGSNIDLIQKRSKIAMYGSKRRFLDVYGKGWPSGISKEDSRVGNWVERKENILKNYHFNLCFENTVFPHYITEKIWDSIENHCLPIYFGGKRSSIYSSFPKNSFIDYNEYKNEKELFDYIQNISSSDFVERMNKCLSVYNFYSNKPVIFWEEIKKEMLDNIVQNCQNIINENLR